jgi:PAS domain S-box-containing protein
MLVSVDNKDYLSLYEKEEPLDKRQLKPKKLDRQDVFVDPRNGHHNGVDDSLYSSRLLKNYVEYMKEFHPHVDIDPIFDYAGIASYEIEDEGHWFTQQQVDRFHEILTQKTGDNHISRKVGRFAASSKASGPVRQYALGLITPWAAYWAAEKLSSKLSRAFTFRVRKLGADRIEVTAITNPRVSEKPFQCENRLGLLEAVSKLFTNKFPKIDHPACIHNGDPVCRYLIKLEKPPFLIWRLANRYCLILGALVLLPLFFFLPFATWISLALLCPLFSMAFSTYSAHLEKRDLIKTIETQGDAAKDLIEEANIRYSNALLIQEIGQATSTTMHEDELARTVVSAIERHLDFDRGMIMLADKTETRLVYAAGFGYNEEQASSLNHIEFHLDKPESKGMFVVAFREQRPFLVDDITQKHETLSLKSMDLAKQLGVRSLICVPIVYEGKSLGILAADNIESKRPLTQSDVNLLMGVAAQTAVNIVEARSYQKLEESEKKYRDLVENANSIILRMDTDGNITFINDFAQKLLGYSEYEILGKNIRGTIVPETDFEKRSLESLVDSLRRNPDKPAVSEKEYALRNGNKVWIAWTNKAIFDADGEFREILSIGNDLTELKQAAQEKEELEARLQEAQKMEAIGTLAGGIAHDFNNILQAILGYTQILLLKREPKDPDYGRLEAIKGSARTAADLTKRLLIFSRKVESKLKPVDLNQEVVQVSKMLERTIPRMIEIQLQLAEDLEIINADPVQAEQIMMNLGINARDAMPEGGQLIFETRNVQLDAAFCAEHLEVEPGDYVRLRVSDTGHGMDRETKEHIFEPFFTTKGTGMGTGLGLAMVYGIVKNHNGCIVCESSTGQGTVFDIYFPVLRKELDLIEVRESDAPIKAGRETILLVDDEKSILEPWKEIFSEFGYSVLTAPDGESALETYRKKQQDVDLIILDLIMPGMGGRRCLEEVLKINPEAKVIVASGYSVDALTRDALEAGAKVFVSKPYEISQMLKAVREVLDGG